MPFRRDENDLVDRTPSHDRPLSAERMDEEKFERAIEALENGRPREGQELGGRAKGTGVRGISALAGLAARAAVDPVGSLAADLCETAIYGAMPPEEIVATARACREAALLCYGLDSPPVTDPPINEMTRKEVARRYPLPPPAEALEGAEAVLPDSARHREPLAFRDAPEPFAEALRPLTLEEGARGVVLPEKGGE
jgi:hypothetical protein